MTRRQRSLMIVAAVLLVALVTACSGDDESPALAPLPGTGDVGPEAPVTTAGDVTTTAASDATARADTTSPAPMAASTSTTTLPATTSASPPATTSTTSPPTDTTSTTAPPGTRPQGPFVRIGDDYFTFTPDSCFVYDGIDAVVSGPGEAPDGTPIYVSLEVSTLRIDIGSGEPFVQMDDHWAAGEGYGDDMVVTLDVWTVKATGTFVYGPTGRHVAGEFEAECEG